MDDPALYIVKALPADIEKLQVIFEEARKFKHSLGDKAWGSNPFTIKEVTDLVAQDNMYSVWVNDELAGTFQLTYKDTYIWDKNTGSDKLAGYVHLLAIRDAYRGQKLGPKIIAWICGELHASGLLYLRLDCDSRNRLLCEYYEHQGFTEVARRTSPHNPSYIASLYQKSVI